MSWFASARVLRCGYLPLPLVFARPANSRPEPVAFQLHAHAELVEGSEHSEVTIVLAMGRLLLSVDGPVVGAHYLAALEPPSAATGLRRNEPGPQRSGPTLALAAAVPMYPRRS